MEIIQHYKKCLDDAIAIFTSQVQDSAVNTKSEFLKNKLDKDNFIKIPVVGEFNAGKSTLLNAMLEQPTLLPTAIIPETAVAYELLYSTDPHIEIVKGNSFKRASLQDINNADVDDVDFVRVYIDNAFVKALNDKHLVLIDMPGINSGLERHAKALARCLSEGTVFVLCSDVTQGTLTTSSLKFLDEISHYGLRNIVLITQSDRRPPEETKTITDLIKINLERNTSFKSVPVYLVSALESESWKPFSETLLRINAEELIKEKYSNDIKAFIGELITTLSIQLAAAQTPNNEYDEKIKEIKKIREKTLSNLVKVNAKAQTIAASVDDILNDVRDALWVHLNSIAEAVCQRESTDNIGEYICSIIRQVIGTSINRELEDYNDVIMKSINDFSQQFVEAISDDGALSDFFSKILTREIIEKGLGDLVSSVVSRTLLGKILSVLGKLSGPLATILSLILPNILTKLFKSLTQQSYADKISRVKEKIKSELIPQIISKIRPEVTKVIEEGREKMLNDARKNVEARCQEYDKAIAEQKQKKSESESQRQSRIENLEASITELNKISQTI